MVGVEGFEPPTSCSQSRRATRLRYTPKSRAETERIPVVISTITSEALLLQNDGALNEPCPTFRYIIGRVVIRMPPA